MAIPNAEKMIERAQKGEKLNAADRRHCVAYYMATAPEVTNVAMAELFQVTEKVIRQDRLKIREDRARLLKEEDVALVVADIAINFQRQMDDLEKGKRKCTVGSRTHLEYCKAIANLQVTQVKALQELGYYPKNLGNMTVAKFEYRAVVGKDGSVDTRPVHLITDAEVLDADFTEIKQLEAPVAQYADDDKNTNS